MRIFIGTSENCGILNGLSIGFKKLGHEVTSFVRSRDAFFNDIKYDFDLSSSVQYRIFKSGIINKVETKGRNFLLNKRIKKLLNNEFLENDIFVFTWSSLLNHLEDLPLLKKLNKKIVFVFIGSEIRNAVAFKQQFQDINIPWPEFLLNESLNKKLRFIRTIELYADTIHALPDLAGLLIRPYYPTFVPYILDKKPFEVPDNPIVKIIHAPSSRNLKGTQLILQILERLKNDNIQFDFSLIEKQPNEFVIENLAKADIAIDQIYLHYPGIFSTEGMATGCAVATRFFEGENAFIIPPMCNVNEYNLYEKLRHLIENREYRLKLANAGRDFVKNNCSPEVVASNILNPLVGDQKPPFQPTFFMEKFQMDFPDALSKSVKNLTMQVARKFYGSPINWASLKQRNLI